MRFIPYGQSYNKFFAFMSQITILSAYINVLEFGLALCPTILYLLSFVTIMKTNCAIMLPSHSISHVYSTFNFFTNTNNIHKEINTE